MARFHSHSLILLCQILCPLLLLIFTIIIHPSNGEPLHAIDLVNGVCSLTSDNDFCVDTLTPNPGASNAWPTAGEIATIALSYAQSKADDAGSLIARLLNNCSISIIDLRACQLLNKKAIKDLSLANNNLNSHTIDAMVEGLNNAANATKSCQGIIQGQTSFSELANKNSYLIKFCEISVASTKFFP